MKFKIFYIFPLILLSFFIYTYFFSNNTNEYKGEILSVNNSNVVISGISKIGNQEIKLKVTNGPYKNYIFKSYNLLSGSLEYDEFYKKGDKILLALEKNRGNIFVKPISIYRADMLLILCAFFIIILISYAKFIGIKAILSFFISITIIWKFYIPFLSSTNNIFFITMINIILLSATIIFLVAGINKKGISAFIGTIFGLFFTIILTFIFGHFFRIDGMNQIFSQELLISKGLKIDILQIFYSAITLGASGACMDIAMDISATIDELYSHSPKISKFELMKSGFNVSKLVIGTMSTTLLLAYSGSFLTLLILFLDRGLSIYSFFNLKFIVAEIFKILIGSIGVVIVAPITVIVASHIYTFNRKIENNNI